MRGASASRARLVVVGVVAYLWLVLLLGRLVDLQVLQHDELARQAQRQQQRTLEVTPKRGVLYDRNGRELAVSITVSSVFAIPADVTDPALTARLLAPVLETEAAPLENRLRSSSSFVWLQRKLDADTAERAKALNLAGIYFQPEYKRFYPKREMAAHVLGFVGIDENGLGGIEYELDSVIRGRSRRLAITADGRRRWFERRNDVPTEGASVVLTLDENIQYIAEQELSAAIERTQSRQGTVIVQQPQTGEILALANYPTFNPNNPTAVPTSWRVNPAVSLAYEPGSTFKLVTLAGALEEGIVRPDEVIDCQQGSIEISGHRIRDWKAFGLLSLREVMHNSSDVGAIKVGLRLGNERMYQHIRQWRFGEPTGIELPAESRGLVRPPARWSQISIGAVSMGQEVSVTPMQLVAATSAIANGGIWVRPRLVKEILRENQAEQVTPEEGERIISVGVAEELRRMLTGVVTQGTGREAQPAGYSAGGKTGTAQKIDASGRYSSTDFIASFAGFGPAQEPAVSIVVVLDSPRGRLYHGGEVAAPVFRAVAQRTLAYLNIPRDRLLPPQRPAPRLERAAAPPTGKFEQASWTKVLPPSEAERAPTPAGLGFPAAASADPAEAHGRHSIVLKNADTVRVPDFTGFSLRAVTEKCSALGLEAVIAGSGLAGAQRPPAGTRVPRGSRVWVEFSPALPSVPIRPM